MLPRIWIALLALVLLVAPAESASSQIADPQTQASVWDDDALAHARPAPAGGAEDRPARAAKLEDTVPPGPAPARIFRPPRPSLD